MSLFQTVEQGQPFEHSWISLHTRVPPKIGSLAFGERSPGDYGPRTYWLTITLPWKRDVYDITTDEMVHKCPRMAIGFRFWRDR